MERLLLQFREHFSNERFKEALITARNVCSLCNGRDSNAKNLSYLVDNYSEIKKQFEDFTDKVKIDYKFTVGIHTFVNLDPNEFLLLENIINYLITNNYKVFLYTHNNRNDNHHLPYTFTLSNPRMLLREQIQPQNGEKLDYLIITDRVVDLESFYDYAPIIFCFGKCKNSEFFHGVLDNDKWLDTFKNPRKIITIPKRMENYRDPYHPLETYLGIPIGGIICISLVENSSEREEMDKQASTLGFPVQYFLANRHEKGWIGCMESHYAAIRMAKSRRWKEVLILEGDARFIDSKLWPKVSVPENYDILYLGCNPLSGWKYRHNMLKVIEAYATHAYLVSERIYDLILDNMNKDWWENPSIKGEKGYSEKSKTNDVFNRFYINTRGNSYCIYPMICHQKPGYSSTLNTMVDFTDELNRRAEILYNLE